MTEEQWPIEMVSTDEEMREAWERVMEYKRELERQKGLTLHKTRVRCV